MKSTFLLSAFAVFTSLLLAVPLPAKPNENMQDVLDELAKLGGKPIEQLTPKEAREQPSPADAVTALLKKRGESTEPEQVAKVEDKSIAGTGGEFPLRIYTPVGQGPFPVILYIHGGGWVIADLDTYDSSPRALANAAKAIVVSTHYRLAPEHPFPASHDDTFTAYQWTLKNAASFNGDAGRIALVGESAGGNMAAAISLMAREQKLPFPLYQVLIYPVVGADMGTPSFKKHANAKPLNKAMMGWFAKHELRSQQDKQDPRIDLLHADLKGMPPTTIITAEIDPLRSGGQMLANKLKAAGVDVEYKNYDGVTHEFFGMGAVLDESKKAVKLASKNLMSAFNRTAEKSTKADSGKR